MKATRPRVADGSRVARRAAVPVTRASGRDAGAPAPAGRPHAGHEPGAAGPTAPRASDDAGPPGRPGGHTAPPAPPAGSADLDAADRLLAPAEHQEPAVQQVVGGRHVVLVRDLHVVEVRAALPDRAPRRRLRLDDAARRE